MNFDRLAPFYRAMEFFSAGGKLQRCRVSFLDLIPVPDRILLVGEGNGRFLPECIRRFPDAEIVVVDTSHRMLAIAQKTVASDRVQFVEADIQFWSAPKSSFDLIVTHFFLDCFPADDIATLVTKLGDLATPNANWLLADFQIAGGRIAALRCRVILSLLYTFFRIVCDVGASSLVSPDSELGKNGFLVFRRVTCEWGLLKSEWWHRPTRDVTGQTAITGWE